MASKNITEEGFCDLVFSSVLESTHTTFPVDVITEEDMHAINKSSSELDVDYLMIREHCQVVMKSQSIRDLFFDMSCKFFPRPVKDRIYGNEISEVLSIGKIGDYKIATEIIESVEETPIFQVIDDDVYISQSDLSDTGDAEILIQDNTLPVANKSKEYSYQSILESTLSRLANIYDCNISFDALREMFLECFPDITVIIFKYGQKISLPSIKPKLVNILSIDKIPIEIALGIQVHLNNYFLCAKYINTLQEFSFSNFLSNEACNIRINQKEVCNSYASNSYRIVVYNSLQHIKKSLSFNLIANKSCENCKISSFSQCFDKLLQSIRTVSKEIKNSELRLEIYYPISNIIQLNKSIVITKSSLSKFSLVKKKIKELEKLFSQRCKLMDMIFDYSFDYDNIRCLFFFLYFKKYSVFINSSAKMTDQFLRKNCGLYLTENWFDKTTKIVNDNFFKNVNVVQIWTLLRDIFGTTTTASSIIGYYYLTYYSHFKEYIDQDMNQLTAVINNVTEIVLCKEKKCTDLKKHDQVSVTFREILEVISSKHSRNIFYSKFISLLSNLIISISVFKRKIIENFILNQFTLVHKKTIYVLKDEDLDSSTLSTWKKYQIFSTKFKYEQLINCSNIFDSDNQSLTLQEFNFAHRIYNEYLSFKNEKDEIFLNTNQLKIQLKFSPTYDVFMSFFLATIPMDHREEDSNITKLVNIFPSVGKFYLFVYLGMMKYYKNSVPLPTTIKSSIKNVIGGLKYLLNKEVYDMTFSRLLYFTGRFDLKNGESGISLPLPKRCDIYPRYNICPFNHLPLTLDNNIPGAKRQISKSEIFR